jgi:hypothetical protein
MDAPAFPRSKEDGDVRRKVGNDDRETDADDRDDRTQKPSPNLLHATLPDGTFSDFSQLAMPNAMPVG